MLTFTRAFTELNVAFTQHIGSVPVPSDAACAQMPPFLASSFAQPAAALRDLWCPVLRRSGMRFGDRASRLQELGDAEVRQSDIEKIDLLSVDDAAGIRTHENIFGF